MKLYHYPDSLVHRVTEYVRVKSRAGLTEIAAQFPDSTRNQVHAALCNARDRRQVKVLMRGYAGRDSIWAMEEEHQPRSPKVARKKPIPVASVWELGSTRRMAQWPPRFEGGREYKLLGEWNAEPEMV